MDQKRVAPKCKGLFSDGSIDKTGFSDKVKTLQSPKIKDSAMTLAQQFRQEGRQVALQEDIVEVLSVRFERLPEGLKEAISAITEEPRLRALLKAALRAATLEDFSRSL